MEPASQKNYRTGAEEEAMADYFKRVQAKTATRFWINNVTREQAHLAIEAGARNCTQNPTYPWKMLNSREEGEEAKALLDQILREGPDNETALMKFQLEMIAKIAEIFEPIYRESKGKDGWVTIQSSPLHETKEFIVEWGKRYREKAPNLMVKIPATESGIAGIEELLCSGCAVLATEVMSIAQLIDVCEVYEKVYRFAEKPPVAALAHIAGIFDEELAVQAEEGRIHVDRDALWQAGVAVAKKGREIMEQRGYHMGFVSGGARGLHHFTEMVGADAAVTINWEGTADKLLSEDGIVIDRFHGAASLDVIDELLEQVPDFRRAYERKGLKPKEYESFAPVVRFRNSFESAWKKTLEYMEKRRTEL